MKDENLKKTMAETFKVAIDYNKRTGKIPIWLPQYIVNDLENLDLIKRA